MSDAPGANRPPPSVSIDEALELFLALTFPNGLPEGVDRKQLVQQMRAKIAADRPGWAATSQAAAVPSSVPPPGPFTPPPSYSQVKDAAVRKAQQPDVPSDPQERYLEERRKQATENRERREQEERETEAKAELIRRLLASKREAEVDSERPLRIPAQTGWTVAPSPGAWDSLDADTRERALHIRQLLVEGLARPLQIGAPSPKAPSIGSPEVHRPPHPSPESATPKPARASLPTSGPELAKMLRELTPDEQLEVLRGFSESRRALMKRREDLLAERRPSRKAVRGEPLGFSEPLGASGGGLSLEAPDSRRARRQGGRARRERERLSTE